MAVADLDGVSQASTVAEVRQAHVRPGLDGIRGFAVVAVMAYHLGHLSGGFLGVDVFFVLSGYLITGLALRELDRRSTMSLTGFWGRRWRRLMPAVLVMVAAVVAACLALGWPRDQLHGLGLDALSTLTWWSNWRQAGGASYWASVENPFRHAWSLSIEEQFYLVWPVVLVATAWVARRLRRSTAAAVGLVAGLAALASGGWQLALSLRLDVADLSRVYVGTDTRAVAPLAGCALACVLHGRDRAGRRTRVVGKAVGLAGAAILVWLSFTAVVSAPELYRHGLLLLSTVASLAVVAAAGAAEPTDRDPLGWVSTRRFPCYLGRRSYGLYLWSWPTQVLLRFHWPDISAAALVVGTVAISWALAEASYRAIEVPQRHRNGWATRPAPRRTAWGGEVVWAFAMVAACFALAVPLPAHERIDTAESAADALGAPPTTATGAEGEQPQRVMLVGDSVAWTVGYYGARSNPYPGIGTIDSRAVIGCGMLAPEGWKYPQGEARNVFTTPGGSECPKQIEAERIGLTGKPDVVVMMPGAWEWSDVQSPSGHRVPARSDEMEAILTTRIVRRARAADEAGARLVVVDWSCPGPKTADVRSDPAYIRWINGVLRRAVAKARAEGLRAEVVAPNAKVCVGGDPTGEATPAKDRAMGSEVHVVDAAGAEWLWKAWLGPALVGAS